ncbi:hypothetical protein CGLAU_04035 [Corynebacterium glaucum]|uniref:Uncharacterized protein n=1 Tax=Corynebacterium glaucum TaxID=187491 RepID=A0A1Q2HVC3_9CORY|nr:hypothetical protein [Corynebacterium glaucum]AQQ14783.1 hypothetical protein CGLAU_04035 [Corynebacterium glaucum]
MGFMDRVRDVFGGGDTASGLVELPRRYERVVVKQLLVHTANLSPDTDEKLVIITTTPEALEELRALRGPLQLAAEGQRPVTFVPSNAASAPVLDPNHGWIIPVSPATAAELQALPAGPGEHELTTIHVGLVLQ